MTDTVISANLLNGLADLLEYPGSDLHSRTRDLGSELEGAAAAALDEFRAGIEELSLERLQEIYAATFDLNPACCLYAGYHLFGDSYKRGALMAKLNQEYRQRGFAPGNELPDHIAVTFRFLATLDEPEFRSTLLAELVLPAVTQIVRAFEGTDNLYAPLLRAVLAGFRAAGYEPPRDHGLPVLNPDQRISTG